MFVCWNGLVGLRELPDLFYALIAGRNGILTPLEYGVAIAALLMSTCTLGQLSMIDSYYYTHILALPLRPIF